MMTRETYRRIAAYARMRMDSTQALDETTAKLFDASADEGSMTAVFRKEMRPWLEGAVARLAPHYTAEELAAKPDAFLLGYLALKLASELPPEMTESPEVTEQDRADALTRSTQLVNESDDSFKRRVDEDGKRIARQRVHSQRIQPERVRDPQAEEADKAWRQTLRDGEAEKQGTRR